MLTLRCSLALRAAGEASAPPNICSKMTRGFRSIGSGCVGVPESIEEHFDLLFDLAALAWQADLTRVTNYLMAREWSTMTYPQIGVIDPHHPISHNNDVAANVAKKVKIDTYHIERFARFLKKLQAMPEGDGSVLDHSTIVWGSGISNGNGHINTDLPTLVIGRDFRGPRHIEVTMNTPLSNLMLTIIQKAGVNMEQFGNSTGVISEL